MLKAIEATRPLPPAPPSPHPDPFLADAERARRNAISTLEGFLTRVVREKLADDDKDVRIRFRAACASAFSWLLSQDLDFWRRYAMLAKTPRDLFALVNSSHEPTRILLDDLKTAIKISRHADGF